MCSLWKNPNLEAVFFSLNPVELKTTAKKWIIRTPSKERMESIINKTDVNFCVMSGKEYCLKVISFHHSLQKHCKTFNLWICCMDDFTFSLLEKLNLENVHLIQVEELEDETLRRVKQERKPNEYCWTIKAVLIEYLLTKYNLEKIIYCDGDLYFFSDPVAIFEEWDDYSVFLCPQRDLDWVEQMYGKFQAGLIGFKNDPYGIESLKWWKERCIEWCSQENNNGRYGDQKYLDQFPLLFQKVKISEHLGINAAPWNTIYNNNYEISTNNQKVFIQNQELVVFHFACLSIYDSDKFDLWSLDQIKIQKAIINEIYIPYLNEIQSIIREINIVHPNALSHCFSTRPDTEAKTFYYYTTLRREMDQYDDFFNFAIILSQEYLIKGITLYFSLIKQMENFHMWICCMDKVSFKLMKELRLPNITLIQVEEIEDEQIRKIKKERTLQEYCWTLKAPLCQYILNNYREAEHILYCDSDMYFFSNPKTILEQWGKYSIYMCKQRGTAMLEKIHGQYQAGLIGFKNEENSLKILKWWREKCIELCSSNYIEIYDTWGDQKYLDAIPHLFQNIMISDHPGINTAPWNLIMNNSHTISRKEGKLAIDDQELIAYHFGSMLMFSKDSFDLWKLAPLPFPSSVIELIYLPYLQNLKLACRFVQNMTSQQNLSPFFNLMPYDYQAKNPFAI